MILDATWLIMDPPALPGFRFAATAPSCFQVTKPALHSGSMLHMICWAVIRIRILLWIPKMCGVFWAIHLLTLRQDLLLVPQSLKQWCSAVGHLRGEQAMLLKALQYIADPNASRVDQIHKLQVSQSRLQCPHATCQVTNNLIAHDVPDLPIKAANLQGANFAMCSGPELLEDGLRKKRLSLNRGCVSLGWNCLFNFSSAGTLSQPIPEILATPLRLWSWRTIGIGIGLGIAWSSVGSIDKCCIACHFHFPLLSHHVPAQIGVWRLCWCESSPKPMMVDAWWRLS